MKIIPPDQFRKSLWKNGKGETTELAINPGGTLESFQWRISIASVIEDGPFSDFPGFERNLILIQGNGIELVHDTGKTSRLENILDIANFDGGSKTHGALISGPITDFNLMNRSSHFHAQVDTYVDRQSVRLMSCDQGFVFCLEHSAGLIEPNYPETRVLPGNHLLQFDQGSKDVQVLGEKMIVIHLDRKRN